MFDAIDNLRRVATPGGLTPPPHFTGSVKSAGSPSDQVDIPSPDLALSSFHTQIGALKKELPGMIAAQSSGVGGTTQNDPVSVVAFRLTDPLSYILKGNSLTQDQLTGFQKEVSKFRDEVMGLTDPAANSAQANTKNDIVAQIANNLGNVINQIQSKILNL